MMGRLSGLDSAPAAQQERGSIPRPHHLDFPDLTEIRVTPILVGSLLSQRRITESHIDEAQFTAWCFDLIALKYAHDANATTSSNTLSGGLEDHEREIPTQVLNAGGSQPSRRLMQITAPFLSLTQLTSKGPTTNE